MNPIPSSQATGHPNMKPLDSGPTITSAPLSLAYFEKSFTEALKASPLEINVVISLNIIPFLG